MGHVVVGHTTKASTHVCNYGCQSAEVYLNYKSCKINKLAEEGINIHFKKHTSLMPGEDTHLEVSYTPLQLKSSEKSSVIRRKFYLEVI